jgi:hypothetical protein
VRWNLLSTRSENQREARINERPEIFIKPRKKASKSRSLRGGAPWQKERRDVVALVETKRSISFLWGCVDGNILAPESLATKPERFSCELRPILPFASL